METKPAVVILSNTYTTWTEQDIALGQTYLAEMMSALRELGHRVETAQFTKDPIAALTPFDPREWIVFNWCEGVEDEVGGDARVCQDLENMGYVYTGNTPQALRLSVQKGVVKQVLSRWNIPTPPGRTFNTAGEIEHWEHFPAIVKPVSQHCSYGVNRQSVVHDTNALRERVGYIIALYQEAALVEKFVSGREINVGIWGNGRPRLLPLREIDFSAIANPFHRMVTWDSKWEPNSEDWNKMPVIFDVDISVALRSAIEKIAMETYRVCGCRDYARIDFRIDEANRPWVVDVNPNPDICSDGGFIGGCKMLGYSYGQAISHIVHMALMRRNRSQTVRARHHHKQKSERIMTMQSM
jgi:D-alanine-D-alanine ligase